MANLIQVNNISGYGHIDSKWLIEDKSFRPQVINSETGHVAEWIPQRGKGQGMRAEVTMKDGRKTSISLDRVFEDYESRHPY